MAPENKKDALHSKVAVLLHRQNRWRSLCSVNVKNPLAAAAYFESLEGFFRIHSQPGNKKKGMARFCVFRITQKILYQQHLIWVDFG